MGKSKKSRRKGKKGKKGKKKAKPVIEPLPLHSLTDIYKKIDILIYQLLDARVIARKKRIEATLMDEEDLAHKRDNQVYKDHLNDQLKDIEEQMEDVLNRLKTIKDELQKEIDRINEEYDKRLLLIQAEIERREEELLDLMNKLKEMEPLMKMVAELLERIRLLQKEYERAQLEVTIKCTHLRNQYLNMRAELFIYLEEQLAFVVAQIRSYLIPIIWNNINEEQRKNMCNRQSLLKAGDNNFRLLTERQKYLSRLETMEWEKQYYGTEWVFEKLYDMKKKRLEEKLRWKKRLQEIEKNRSLFPAEKKTVFTPIEKPKLTVIQDFEIFFKQMLLAAEAEKAREEREAKPAVKRKGGRRQPRSTSKKKTDSDAINGGCHSKRTEVPRPRSKKSKRHQAKSTTSFWNKHKKALHTQDLESQCESDAAIPEPNVVESLLNINPSQNTIRGDSKISEDKFGPIRSDDQTIPDVEASTMSIAILSKEKLPQASEMEIIKPVESQYEWNEE